MRMQGETRKGREGQREGRRKQGRKKESNLLWEKYKARKHSSHNSQSTWGVGNPERGGMHRLQPQGPITISAQQPSLCTRRGLWLRGGKSRKSVITEEEEFSWRTGAPQGKPVDLCAQEMGVRGRPPKSNFPEYNCLDIYSMILGAGWLWETMPVYKHGYFTPTLWNTSFSMFLNIWYWSHEWDIRCVSW